MIGDHIRTLRAGRWTHAIDCGDETVIALGDDDGQPPRVRRSYRPEFVAGADAVELVLHRERTFPAPEVVARAYSRIADPGLAAMFRDSEAFAEWCTTGRLPSAPRNAAIADPAAAKQAATTAPIASSAVAKPKRKARKAAASAKTAAKARPARAARTKPARAARSPKVKPTRKTAARRAAARKRRGRR